MEYYDPNEIHPKTKTLTGSIAFFTTFCLRMMHTNRRRKKLLLQVQTKLTQSQQKAAAENKNKALMAKQKKKVPAWIKRLRKLNEQRQNLVLLADYTASIVAPSFFFLTLGALMTSIIPHYYSMCIQLVATLDGTTSKVWEALIGLTVASTLGALFTGMRGSLFWIAGSRANYNIRVKLHRNLLLQEAAFFDSNETGYLLSRLNSDVNKIGQVISYHVNVVFRQFAQFLFGSAYLIKISPKLSLWTFCGILAVAWVSAVYGKFNRDLAQKVQDTFAEATAVAETSFSMSETIRAFDGVETESGKYEGAQSNALDLEEVQAWGYGTHKFVSDTLQAVLQAVLLLACWTMGRAGGLPAGQLTTYMFYTNFVLESSNEVGDQWAKIQGAIGASTSVFDLIRRIPRVRDPPKKQIATLKLNGASTANAPEIIEMSKEITSAEEAPLKVNGGSTAKAQAIIEMSDVTVTYGTMDVPALNKVDLKIYEGDRVAIVGRSGSGKSSMLRSILRFYDPSSGTIRLDGKPLTEMSRKDIASRISVVEQEPHLFPMSLMDNVLYGIAKDAFNPATGEPFYSDSYRKAATESLQVAGLAILPGNDLNLELDTRVGEGGRALSGGQRQRVAIARALIRHPYVLLLDEPTAALDSQSEKAVVSALKSAMDYSKSMIMVTHRLGVVRALGVNRVIVLERGEIAESGHPEELLRKEDSLYASLAREQGITTSIKTAM